MGESQLEFGQCCCRQVTDPEPSSSTSTSTTASAYPSSSSPAPSGPAFVPGNDDFTLLGCYAEPNNARALPNRYYIDDMTVEACLAKADGYEYAAVEYGSECWYGNSLDSGTTGADSSECQMTCSGNSMEYCGGGYRLVLYSANGAPAAPATQPPIIDGAYFYACMTEATNERALSGANYADDAMTLGKCATFCAAFKYFGVE